MLNAVQTDLDVALFPKNLQLNSQEETCSCTVSLGGCADSSELQPWNKGQGLGAGMRQLTFYWLGVCPQVVGMSPNSMALCPFCYVLGSPGF